MRFGKLVVLDRAANDGNHRARWNCICDCGNTLTTLGGNLSSGRTSSCGCLVSPDLTGRRFGRLTVLRRDVSAPYQGRWLCSCDCGNTITAYTSNLKRGHTKSCGCLHKDVMREVFGTHGESHTRLHNIWLCMKERCGNPNAANYHYYGGRGITVCDEWKSNYIAFRDWALANGYSSDLSIDRIDVNGDYEPSNCRWATSSQQNSNKRNSKSNQAK